MDRSQQLSQTFSALGDTTRFRLFQLLGSHPESCVSQLAEQLRITPACVSQHMKILQTAGLVKRVRSGQRVCYEITTDTADTAALGQLIFNT